MIWWLFLFCAARILWSDLEPISFWWSHTLHQACLTYTEWRQLPLLYNGLICGSKNIGDAATILFQSTGLYHVIVVSGSHLIFIDRYLKKLSIKHIGARGIALTFYSCICLLNPPVLRALTQILFTRILRSLPLSLRRDQMTLGAGLLILIFIPSLIASLSLQLSWAAALCMSLSVSPAKKACLCLLYIAPLLGLQNPLFAINNMLFLVAFDSILFPFTVVTFAVPGTSVLAHGVWNCILSLMAWLPSHSMAAVTFADTASGWLCIFALQLLHYWLPR